MNYPTPFKRPQQIKKINHICEKKMKKVVDKNANTTDYRNMKTKDKEIRIPEQFHRLLYKRWKATGMGIRAQIAELIEASPKYDAYREAAK